MRKIHLRPRRLRALLAAAIVLTTGLSFDASAQAQKTEATSERNGTGPRVPGGRVDVSVPGGGGPIQLDPIVELQPPADDDTGDTLRIPAPTNVIKVKFRDGHLVRLRPEDPKDRDSRLVPVGLDGKSLTSPEAKAIMEELNQGEWARTHLASEYKLEALRASTEKALGKRMPDLNSYFALRLPWELSVADAIQLLEKLREVERAAPMRDYYLADAPDYTEHPGYLEGTPEGLDVEKGPYQRYLEPAPVGVDARYAWDFPGGDGFGVNVVNIEGAFDRNHPDLPFVTEDGVLFGIEALQKSIDHGTATFGVMVGLDNDEGVKGIAHGADPYFLSKVAMYNHDNGPNSGVEGAISWATDLDSLLINHIVAGVSEPGDVLVLEVQVAGPNRPEEPEDQTGLIPAEWDIDVFHAIRHATAQGFVVVEAAGNGKQNLDDAVHANHPDAPHRPFAVDSDGNRLNDSGAIIVGAGRSDWESLEYSSFTPRERLDFSNYGRRVDVQAWGEKIVTTGSGLQDDGTIHDDPFDGAFRADYAGTSGATAILGGVVTSLQGVYKSAALAGGYLSSNQMRQLLIETGTPQAGDTAATEHIGPLPDMRAAIDRLLLNRDELVIEQWDTYCGGVSNDPPALAPPEFSHESGPVSTSGPTHVRLRFGGGVFVEGSSIFFTTNGGEPNTNCPTAVWPSSPESGAACQGTGVWELVYTVDGYFLDIDPEDLPVTIRAQTAIQYCWIQPGLASEIVELVLTAE